MAYQHKEGSGSLFKNDKKLSDKHPDYKGDALINGKEVWLSAWIKEGNKGKFMSLSIQEKDAVQQQGMQQAKQAIEPDGFMDLEDSIPF